MNHLYTPPHISNGMEHLLDLNQAFYALSAAPTQPLTLVIGTTSRTGLRPTMDATHIGDPEGRLQWRLVVPSKIAAHDPLLDLTWTSTDIIACSVFGRKLEGLKRVDWDGATYTLKIKL